MIRRDVREKRANKRKKRMNIKRIFEVTLHLMTAMFPLGHVAVQALGNTTVAILNIENASAFPFYPKTNFS